MGILINTIKQYGQRLMRCGMQLDTQNHYALMKVVYGSAGNNVQQYEATRTKKFALGIG